MWALAKYRMKPNFSSHDVGNSFGRSHSNLYVYTPGAIATGLSVVAEQCGHGKSVKFSNSNVELKCECTYRSGMDGPAVWFASNRFLRRRTYAAVPSIDICRCHLIADKFLKITIKNYSFILMSTHKARRHVSDSCENTRDHTRYTPRRLARTGKIDESYSVDFHIKYEWSEDVRTFYHLFFIEWKHHTSANPLATVIDTVARTNRIGKHNFAFCFIQHHITCVACCICSPKENKYKFTVHNKCAPIALSPSFSLSLVPRRGCLSRLSVFAINRL